MANKQKQGKSHKLRRSSARKSKCERQWYRTGANKLRRVNYQRSLAGLPPLKGMNVRGPKGTTIYVTA